MTAFVFLLVKSLLVFAAAGFALLALSRASAAARHLVCLLTLAALLALPLLSLALPGWQMLPALPGALNERMGEEPAPQKPTPPQAATLPKGEGEEFRTGSSGLKSSSSRFGRTPMSAANKEVGSFRLLALLSVYALGAGLALLRPLLGLWGIRQLSRVSTPITDTSALSLAAACAAALRLARTPALRQATVPVPMTWGSRRAVILLSNDADHWPEDRLRAVLLHEMAHVLRRDWPSHRLADAACALYWFHPLVWLTARRLRAESEVACDDLVLSSGIAAPDYARHLLEIARALPPVLLVPQTAIAMAHTSQVESRLKMILNSARDRRILTRRSLLLSVALGAAALVPLAMLRSAVQAQTTTLTANRSGVTGAMAQLKQIYHILTVYRARHGGDFPATNSNALLADLTGHPQAYGLPDCGAGDGAQARHLFTSPDSAFMDGGGKAWADKMTVYYYHNKRPDGTLKSTPKRAGTRDVFADTDLYVRDHPRGSTGFYLVLWDDGTVEKIPAGSILTVPAYDVTGPAGATELARRHGTKQIAFPGQAGLPQS